MTTDSPQQAPILHLVGARPNYMKVAPVMRALAARDVPQLLVHTGQHYDPLLADDLMRQLGMPEPDLNLGVGSGSASSMVARILLGLEPVLAQYRPALVVVAGDVNSSLAGALAAVQAGIPLAHVEAGLRSGDRTMPEETNRIVIDHLANLLFASEPAGGANLAHEGVPPARTWLVGNCMIDSLCQCLPAALATAPWSTHDVSPRHYALLTLHRPANVDAPAKARALLEGVNRVAAHLPVVFPVHPRAVGAIKDLGFVPHPHLHLVPPQGYLEFLGLMAEARLVLTDSGGIQEETTALRVPCLTLRANTERPITLTEGSNELVAADAATILAAAERALAGPERRGQCPALWDGHASERIAAQLVHWLAAREASR